MNGLISYLFYNCALTWSEDGERLVIPNDVARKDYIDELKRMFKLSEDSLQELKKGLVELKEKRDPSVLFCGFYRYILSAFKGHDVKEYESSFSAALFAAMKVAGTNFGDVDREVHLDVMKSLTALDLVWSTKSPQSTPIKFVFELKNVGAAYVGPKEERQYDKLWDHIATNCENFLRRGGLNTKLRYVTAKGSVEGDVQEAMQRYVEDTKVKYSSALAKEGEVYGWVLMRVGLKHLFWSPFHPLATEENQKIASTLSKEIFV